MQTRLARESVHSVARALALVTLALVTVPGAAAQAAEEADAPEAEGSGGLQFSWTNTVRYNAAFRVEGADRQLLGNPNLDDGDRNFDTGLVSNRLELLSELDAVAANGWGARVSALGWYDTVYNQDNDNPGFQGGAFPNHTSEQFNEFTEKTRDLHGRRIELRDAFVFGRADIGDTALTMRLGQYALVWGESLFFAQNAIAGGQSAFDIGRLLADPTAQAKEFVLPVPQASAQLQVTPTLTLGAYYQFRYRENRLPAVGSYLSTMDVAVDGAERLLLQPPFSADRTGDIDPSDSGQFGVQLRWRVAETDIGFYAIRFHDKDFQQVVRLGLVNVAPGAPAPVFVVMPTSYYLTWNEDTTAYGVSASRSFGEVNVAMEASIRKDQALASAGHAADASALAPPGVIPGSDNNDHPAYAVGDTAHVNASAIWSLGPSALWREALFIGEVAWNRMLNCNLNCKSPAPGAAPALDSNASRDAVSMRFVFEPTYRQVFSGLDLGVPLGVGYTPKGSRSVLGPSFPPEDGGDVTLGLNATYNQVWRINLAYTAFFGTAAPALDAAQSFSYQQSRADRDFLSLSVRRSF